MNKIYKQVTKEYVLSLPTKTFEGEIHLVETADQITEAANYLNQCKILGFDTETKPAFKKGERNTVALLQLSDGKKAYLFRLDKIGDLPDEIIAVLVNPDIVKIGAAIHDDLRALQGLKDFTPGNFIEIQRFVTDLGILDNSLKKMTCGILGFRISKKARLSNWESETYTQEQIQYAATDAWVSYEIYVKLTELGDNITFAD
ncbi:MAG: 3'-5' exonuclease [Bacteroidia bacterium]|nr:MAG: 3'-5' exonuclease [Bacteroidia bacterium]